MKKIMIGLMASGLFLSTAVSANEDAEIKAQCQQYAVEDKIPAEDMEQFMRECMGLTQPEAPAAETAAPQE